MINLSLYYKLMATGHTVAAENIPAIYNTGGGFDSESTTITHKEQEKHGKRITEKTVVDACFCYAWQYSFNKSGGHIVRRKEQIINVVKDIVETVKAVNKENGNDAIFIIWCANLSHEWSFIKKDIAENLNITKCFAKSQRDVLYIQLDNCVEFRESIGLFGHSLDDIAKNWCSKDNQKLTGQFDYDKIRTWLTPLDAETEQPYMIHDVSTLVEMHENVIKAYTQENGVCRLPYTSSGFVRLALKDAIRADADLTECREIYNEGKKKPLKTNIEYLKKINRHCVVDALQWTVCREYGYSGGLCGSNIDYAGKILKNVVCADLTSDYPAQLSHRLYPSGRLRKIIADDLDDVRRELDKQHKPYFAILKIQKMQAKTRHATFSKHKIINADGQFFTMHGTPKNLICYNGKVYKGENLVVCWNDVDIAAYKEMYNIKAATITLWAFDCYRRLPNWFLRTLWDGYGKKAELKNSGIKSGVEYDDAKRIPNSIYGVCAQRVNDVFDALDDELNFKVSNEKTFKRIAGDFWLNPYIAFWCTSYARKILQDFLSKYPNAIVQYDTDSLYYIKSKGAALEKALQEYNNDILIKNRRIFRGEPNPTLFDTLGQWDFDDVYTKFLGMGAKKYLKQTQDGEIKTVIAGLPKKAIPAEIAESHIKQPFNYYNPLVKWLRESDNRIIIKHTFAHKFASVYGDDAEPKTITITDWQGNTTLQDVSTYHAIIPIDYTLSMAIDYLQHIIKGR